MAAPLPQLAEVQAHVTDAIAQVRQAILMAEDREINHATGGEEPCSQAHAAEDAAVRTALMQSEDAMLDVLEALPPVSKRPHKLAN